MPLQNIFVLLLFSLLLFVSYGLRGTSETYILKTSKKDEGGMLFGIFGNMSSSAVFLATAALPFYVIAGREMLAAWTLIVVYGLSFLILYFLPNDQVLVEDNSRGFWTSLNPLPAVRQGLHFVKANSNYPMLTLGATFFEGIFYGTVWFIFPLHMAKVGLAGMQSGMHLGVYDLVTALFAGYAGFLADKYNWRHAHSLGWFFVIVGLIALPFYGWPVWLVIVGFVIAIGNNLSYYAAAHALEANDIDHREDGSFVGLKSVASSLGYAISPLIAGYLYSRYGFAVSLSVNSALCIIIAIAMIWFTWRLENLPVKKDKSKKRIRNKQVVAQLV
jgi:MFS family permease